LYATAANILDFTGTQFITGAVFSQLEIRPLSTVSVRCLGRNEVVDAIESERSVTDRHNLIVHAFNGPVGKSRLSPSEDSIQVTGGCVQLS